MTRFSGKIGFGTPVEVSPGIWDEEILEKQYYGTVEWDIRRYVKDARINENLNLNNCVVVYADGWLNQNFSRVRYVLWKGQRWTISSVEDSYPRMKFYMGDVYNGPIPAGASEDSGANRWQ